MNDDFSARLAIAIARSGKLKGDLASHCGVALSTVSRWLKGAQPKPLTITQIAEFLSVDVLWLLGEPKNKHEAMQSMEVLIRAVASRMKSDSHKQEAERLQRELAMETTEQFMARMETFKEVAMAFLARCRFLCETIKNAAPEEPISSDLKTQADELWIQWPEMIRVIHDMISEASALRHLAESSPELMKILRSV